MDRLTVGWANRMIDADELKTQLYDSITVNEDMDCLDFLRVESLIDAQPTAYDVDKVVQQLREQQEKLETDIFARESDNWYGQYCNGIHEGIDKAIEIVKAGGVE